MKIAVGSKVKFKGEVQRYTVQASDDRFAICTKPFNPRNTVLYSIVDFVEGVRGPENLVFGHGAETREQCEEMLDRLNGVDRDAEQTKQAYISAGLSAKDIPEPCKTEVSRRHRCTLDIERVDYK